MIRPGKPVFRWVFERLVNGTSPLRIFFSWLLGWTHVCTDPIFRAVQDIAFNEKIIMSSEGTLRTCEEELTTLKDILALERQEWWKFGLGRKSSSSRRVDYLFNKMLVAERKIETLEKANTDLKKVLARGETS